MNYPNTIFRNWLRHFNTLLIVLIAYRPYHDSEPVPKTPTLGDQMTKRHLEGPETDYGSF